MQIIFYVLSSLLGVKRRFADKLLSSELYHLLTLKSHFLFVLA